MNTVYIGMGSNIAQPIHQLNTALINLEDCRDINIEQVSSFYISPPLAGMQQPDYINAVVAIKTSLDPSQLLQYTQTIEIKQNRKKVEHWGPRTIDLDILLYEDKIIQSEQLNIPHYAITERAFVLYPLQEITDNIHIPGHGRLNDIIKTCPSMPLTKLATSDYLSCQENLLP